MSWCISSAASELVREARGLCDRIQRAKSAMDQDRLYVFCRRLADALEEKEVDIAELESLNDTLAEALNDANTSDAKALKEANERWEALRAFVRTDTLSPYHILKEMRRLEGKAAGT